RCVGGVGVEGLGEGSLKAGVDLPGGTYPFGIAAADFDGDGRLDLATANQYSNDVSILFGRPDGTFADAVSVPGGAFAWGLNADDLNGDGKPDLLVTNLHDNSVSVMLGLGDGTFRP